MLDRASCLRLAMAMVPLNAVWGQLHADGWAEEVVAETLCLESRPTDMVISPDGTEHLLYFQDSTTGGRGELRYVQHPGATPWNVGAHSVVGGSGSHRASLAVDPHGTPFAARFELSDETERIMRFDGQLWHGFGPSFLGGAAVKGGMGGRVAAPLVDQPVLACFQGWHEDAQMSRLLGGQWSSTIVESAHRVGKSMCLAVTLDGRIVMAYYNQDTKQTHVAEEQLPLSGQFLIDIIAQAPEPVAIAVQPDGTIVLLARQDNQAPPLELWSRGPGAAWQEDMTFPGGYSYGDLSVDSIGALHVVAVGDAAGQVDYLFEDAGAWGVSRVSDSGSGVSIALTPAGDPRVAFVRDVTEVVVSRPDCGDWEHLGCSLDGSAGTPRLAGEGCLIPGTEFTLTLSQVRPLSVAWLVAGSAVLGVPFKGGCMVPDPDLSLPLFIDANGWLSLTAVWPAVSAPGATLWLQAWIQDPAGPAGFAATNGLRATAP